MWCIGYMNQEYRQRMYHLCDLYRRPYDPAEPVVSVALDHVLAKHAGC